MAAICYNNLLLKQFKLYIQTICVILERAFPISFSTLYTTYWLLRKNRLSWLHHPEVPVPRQGRSKEPPSTPQFSLVSGRKRIVVMATFYSLLSFMSVNGFQYSDSNSFDILSNLPLEITIQILRWVMLVCIICICI